MSDATVPVTFEVRDIERTRRGATLAIASVLVDIAGVEMTLHFAIRREAGGLVVEVPSFIHDGQRVACVILPNELRDAICDSVWAAWRTGT